MRKQLNEDPILRGHGLIPSTSGFEELIMLCLLYYGALLRNIRDDWR